MKKNIIKYRIFIILGLIFALGAFLRVYHFADWLHFELDQSRDAAVVDLALNQGIGNLPLLGPKAAGSFLRLGPIFYYFEYLSALVFGHTPAGMTGLNGVFSILAIPLFYVFMRRYFNGKIALALAALFASSLFLILYARFAWNPNSLPFFILLTLYGLLRAVDEAEKRKGWWLVVGAFALTVATQLHFVAFLGIPAIAGLFLLIKRPRIQWRYWLAAATVIVVLYVPPIINDLKTGGDNIREFAKVFAKKSTAGENTLLEKGIKNYSENALGYLLMTTSNEKAELPKVKQQGLRMDVVCDRDCRDNLGMGAMAMLFFSVGVILMLWQLKKRYSEKPSAQKDFVILMVLWFGITFILFTPIAYDFAPRFFLLIAALPFVFLGFIFQFLEEKIAAKNIFWAIFISAVIFLVLANLLAVTGRFSELAKAKTENFEIATDGILKESHRVTLEQQLAIIDYVQNIYATNKFPVYVNSEAFYRRSFLYLLEARDIVRDDFRNTQIAKHIYRNGNYFLIYPKNVNLDARTSKYAENYDIVAQQNFGTLVVFQLKPKESAINAVEQEFGPAKKARSASGVPVRCRWNEIFDKCNPDEPEDGE
ncbi:MAG: glycosyltransferase family 39 protein [Parcubacteria group bacterium]